LIGSLYNAGFGYNQLSQTDTMIYNNRWYLLSNNRQLLSELYVEHGIIGTLIDQPVDDGFSQGFEVKTGQYSADDIEQIMVYCEKYGVIEQVMQAIKWARLFGGGAVLILTEQDPSTPLDLEKINPNSKLAFKAVDLWELYYSAQAYNNFIDIYDDEKLDAAGIDYYNYYGIQVHHSRACCALKASKRLALCASPARLGMSAVEPVVRSFNQYLKNNDVIFELLDEAKVDVYKMEGFNSSLASNGGTDMIAKRAARREPD